MSEAQIKTPISYITARNCNFLKRTFVSTGHEKRYTPEAKVIKTVFLTSRRHVPYLINIYFRRILFNVLLLK